MSTSGRMQPNIASAEGLPQTWAKDITRQFRRVLSTKRMNMLSSPQSVRSPHDHHSREVITRYGNGSRRQYPAMPVDTTHSLSPSVATGDATLGRALPRPDSRPLRNIPLLPTAPTDRSSLRFRSLLHSLSNTPLQWENPGLLDDALRVIPLERIYEEAQEESEIYEAEAVSLPRGTKAAWGYQDCVVVALMRWFKRDFFRWVNNPECTACGAPTIAMGMAAPTPDEQARSANRVELYQCSHDSCGAYERFPRYSDANVLLTTRIGRCGEWANCFSMLCRAVGSRVRWVWNSEDHVWTEVYSVHRKRWVHVDVCEGAWDQPLLYTQGWKRKLAYCIAFSADGVADVTRRYVRNAARHALPRTKAPEAVLLHILNEIRALRRRDMDKKDKFRLEGEDMREDAEFRKTIIETLAREVGRLMVKALRPDADAQKAAEQRAEAAWSSDWAIAETEWSRRTNEGSG